MYSIGKRLRAIREKLNLKQEELASTLNSNQKSISRYEKDLTNINSEIIVKLVNNFKVNSNWLLTGQGEMFLEDSKSIKKIIKGNNNIVNVDVNNSFNDKSDEDIEKTVLKDIMNKLKDVQDNSLLNYIDDEITALISRIKVKEKYGSSFGG